MPLNPLPLNAARGRHLPSTPTAWAPACSVWALVSSRSAMAARESEREKTNASACAGCPCRAYRHCAWVSAALPSGQVQAPECLLSKRVCGQTTRQRCDTRLSTLCCRAQTQRGQTLWDGSGRPNWAFGPTQQSCVPTPGSAHHWSSFVSMKATQEILFDSCRGPVKSTVAIH